MPDFILLMHNDAAQDVEDWRPYLKRLQAAGVLRGGSAIGGGITVRRSGDAAPISSNIVGFVRIEARDPAHAEQLLDGNPVYEAGGTIEIRALPIT